MTKVEQPDSRSSLHRGAAGRWPGIVMMLLVVFQPGCERGPKPTPSTQPASSARTSRESSDTKRSVVPDRAGSQEVTPRTKPGLFADDLEESSASGQSAVTHRTKFVDVASSSGIEFTYQNGATGNSLMTESTGGGCGWIDFDRDGRCDLYLVQGGDVTRPPTSTNVQPADRLLRNLDGNQFLDITDHCRIDERGYGQGTAVGDFDGDGFDDVFVTNVGRNKLYHNEGDGTFTEVDPQLFGKDSLWSSSAAWGDIDRDGDLDLYVCRYVFYDPLKPKVCTWKNGHIGVCHPKELEPCPDECYLNEGDGTFRPVARERGLFGPNNRALGGVIADFNNDGWPDIFVANDTTENFLFINQQNGHFQEQAQLLGCAVNINGSPQANMGIAVGDYDHNGFLDLYITHYHKEWNTLYQNDGPNGFHDVTAAAQMSVPTLDKLGWGTIMADFDQNGFEELFAVNGHLADLTSEGIDFEMTSQLFAYNGSTWDDRSAVAGEFLSRKILGRGVASADYDDDGDLDLVVVSQNSPTALLKNESQRGHWLKVNLIGASSNRNGIGARVVLTSGKQTLTQELAGGTSYCSSNQPILLFGLGENGQACDLEIRWPSGKAQRLSGVRPDQSVVIREPEGQAATQP